MIMFKKNFYFKNLILVVFLFVVFQNDLTAQKKSSNSDSRYSPSFSYPPPTRTQTASSGITVALIKPTFANKQDNLVAPLQVFTSAMQSEVEVLLIAKGLKVKGPFNSTDERVFSDKKQSDFTLIISINWVAQSNRTWKTIRGPGDFKIKKHDVNINCNLDITAVSNFSSEKLWKKHFPLSPINVSYEGKRNWKDKEVTFWEEFKVEDKLANPINQALETHYKEAMEFLWRQFESEEVKAIVEEAKKERSSDNKKN